MGLNFPLTPSPAFSTSSQRNPRAPRNTHHSASVLMGTPKPPERERRMLIPLPAFLKGPTRCSKPRAAVPRNSCWQDASDAHPGQPSRGRPGTAIPRTQRESSTEVPSRQASVGSGPRPPPPGSLCHRFLRARISAAGDADLPLFSAPVKPQAPSPAKTHLLLSGRTRTATCTFAIRLPQPKSSGSAQRQHPRPPP